MGNPSEDSTKLPADKSSGGPAGRGRKHFNNKGPPAAAASLPISPPPPPTRLVRRRRQTVWAARSHPAQTDFSFRQKGFYELCGYGPFFLPHAQNKRAPFPYRLSRGGGHFCRPGTSPPPFEQQNATAEKGKRSILFGMCRMHSSSLGVGATQLRTVPLFGWVGGYFFSRYRTFKISDAMQMCAIVANKKGSLSARRDFRQFDN